MPIITLLCWWQELSLLYTPNRYVMWRYSLFSRAKIVNILEENTALDLWRYESEYNQLNNFDHHK